MPNGAPPSPPNNRSTSFQVLFLCLVVALLWLAFLPYTAGRAEGLVAPGESNMQQATGTETVTETLRPTLTPTPSETITPGATSTPTPTPTRNLPPPRPGILLISEVLYDPEGPDPDTEWIELYNAGGSQMDISSYLIGDQTAPGGSGIGVEGMYRFPASAPVVGVDEVIVVVYRADAFLANYTCASGTALYEIVNSQPGVPDLIQVSSWGSGIITLNDDGDEILVMDNLTHTLDTVSWGVSTWAFNPPVGDVLQGHSIERVPAYQDTNTNIDWKDQPFPQPCTVNTNPATPTPTVSPTSTPTVGTNTPTVTSSATISPTPSNTATASVTPTRTLSPTPTTTFTPSSTPTRTPTVTPTKGPNIALSLSVKPTQASVNQTFTFTIVAKNNGKSNATTVKVSDTFPSSVDITSATTTKGTATTNSSSRNVSTSIGTLNPGESATITIVVKVNTSATTTRTETHSSSGSWDPSKTASSNSVSFKIIGSSLPGTGGMEKETGFFSAWAALTALLSGILLCLLGMGVLAYSFYARWRRPLWAVSFARAGLALLVVGLLLNALAWGLPRSNPSVYSISHALEEQRSFQRPTLAANQNTGDTIEIWASPPTPTPDKLPDYPVPTPDAELVEESGEAQADTSPVVRVQIPTVGLDAVVKYVPFDGLTWMIGGLREEVAWMGDTSWPGLGGNTGLAAHVTLSRGEPGPFHEINTLSPGDLIVLHTEENIYTYRVLDQIVVTEDNFAVIQPTTKAQLTLITCTDWDTTLKLYINRRAVFAELISTEPIENTTQGN